jgi:hypothetical protein
VNCNNEQKGSSTATTRNRISNADLKFYETVMFTAAITLNRLQQIYNLVEKAIDPEDLELVIDSYEDVKNIRKVTKAHLEKTKAAHSGKNEPPSEKREE